MTEDTIYSACLGCNPTPPSNPVEFPKLASGHVSAGGTEKVAKILCEALESMGLFDEEETTKSMGFRDPLSLDSSGHSQGYR